MSAIIFSRQECWACKEPSPDLLLHLHDLGIDVLATPGHPVIITLAEQELSPLGAMDVVAALQSQAIPIANRAIEQKAVSA